MRKCDCAKDPDGECLPCRSKLVGYVAAVGAVLREFDEKFEALRLECNERVSGITSARPDVCDGCVKKYVDFAMSKLISLLPENIRQQTAEYIFSNILKKLGKHLRKRPLTEKSWANLCKRRGWTGRKS